MDNKTFFDMTYGLFILGVQDGGRPTGCTVNTVMQVTDSPAVLALALNAGNYTAKVLRSTGRVSVNILHQQAPMEVIGSFGFRSGRDVNKFDGVAFEMVDEVPVLKDYICGYFTAQVKEIVSLGTHDVFFVTVREGERVGGGTVEPMTYAYYHSVKRGTVPPSAPHYIAPEKEEQAVDKVYVCTICNYEYDGSDGPFEELPDDWVCPLCGAPKSVFELKA